MRISRLPDLRVLLRPGLLWTVLLTSILAASCQPPSPSTLTLELTDNWEFRLDGHPMGGDLPAGLSDTLGNWLPASVPGTVHTDLLALGLISDPFWRDREMALQWIGEKDWIYRTTFEMDGELLLSEEVELILHGLDTFAEVWLNDHMIRETDNMFRIWRVDAKPYLLSGENTLVIRFRSPLPPALRARAALPYTLPAGNDRGDPPSRVFVRKAAYHYGWDWGPRFVTSGVWRPVELLAWNGARISDLYASTDSLSEEGAFLTVRMGILISQEEAERRAAGGDIPISVTLSSPVQAFDPVRVESVVGPGANDLAAGVHIPDPRLWWPNGLGEAHLYDVQAELQAGRFTDTAHTRLGVRSVELVTEADSMGESFLFRVNGLPVFMKGANVIPLDHFSPRVTVEGYRSLFQDVADANMNMLRVWGGGIYETDLFYDLADEHGILIWQDFMFANGMYPGDSAFLANVRSEVTDQVRRLRGHPSVALWCGNNEIDEGWKNWGWARAYENPTDSATVRHAYEALFHRIIPEVLAQEDPGRPYWPSSPSLGWGDPESLNRGDNHYWGVWHGREPFRVFKEKLPRFASEFGFQALPPMRTVEAFTEEGDRDLYDPVFIIHQKHPIGNELIADYMEREYPVPRDFRDFAYVSQLLQARGMRTAFEAQRRAMPRTMGTLYWQLNDTWPVVSWSSRDYFGRWKALHFAAKEAFAPVLISGVLEGDSVEIWGISDLMEPRPGTLALELLDFDGVTLFQDTLPITLGANESKRIWQASAAELLGDADPREVVLSANFQVDSPQPPAQGSDRGDPAHWGGSAPFDPLYFRTPVELELRAPTILFDLTEVEGGVLLTLESDVLAKEVYLTLSPVAQANEAGSEVPDAPFRFEANFFDLLPNRPRVVFLATALSAQIVGEHLLIRTLAEIPTEGQPASSPNAAETYSGQGFLSGGRPALSRKRKRPF
jgi:beta-mannosidase